MDESRKSLLKMVLVAGLLLAAVLAGWGMGLPAYRNWQQARLVKEAQQYLAKSDLRNAVLCARRALMLKPENPEACQVMATVAEAAGAAEAIQWRQRMVDLQPGVLQYRLDLAKTAFVHGDLPRARKALAGVDVAGGKTPAFQEMAALLAAAGHQIGLSEHLMAEAARQEPGNKRLQLNLAVLHLQARDQTVAQTARQDLERLSTDEQFRLHALRVLQTAALRTNDLQGALGYSTRLVSDPKATLQDKLTHLSVLATNRSPGFSPYLSDLLKAVSQHPEQAFAVAGWMGDHNLSTEALAWLNKLSGETAKAWPIVMAKVNLLTLRKDWPALDQLLQERDWQELEFVRQAFLTRLAAEKENLARQAHWRSAVREADDRLRPLVALTQMAHAWNWTEEKDDLLWQIGRHFSTERWTFEELERHYQQTGQTRNLQKVYAALFEANARDFVARNNLAATSLLLRMNLAQAHRLAREGYDQRPKDSVAVSTYAYSLLVQGKVVEGRRVMETLSPAQIERPAVAAYYGLILASAGDTAKARKIELAGKQELLPEEKSLVEEALKL